MLAIMMNSEVLSLEQLRFELFAFLKSFKSFLIDKSSNNFFAYFIKFIDTRMMMMLHVRAR